jgi:hypothetical protein
MTISTHVCPEKLAEAVVITPKALSLSVTETLLAAAQEIYQDIAVMTQTQSVDAVVASLLPARKYLPHASSVNLGAINNRALVEALLNDIAQGPAGYQIRKMLGSNQVLCDFDQAWIRRQYAPHLYPTNHAPHGWHQDGALGFDFFATNNKQQDPEGLLPTVTCWVALTKCGVDAPGLEFVSQTIEALLLPEELIHDTIKSRFSVDSFFKPQMDAGDALIFQGGTLHRTHVVKTMQTNRTSVELRFVAKHNIPQRLSGDDFIALPNTVE